MNQDSYRASIKQNNNNKNKNFNIERNKLKE